MKRYSIAEFSRFCSELHPETYTYSDENQEGRYTTIRMSARFNNIKISQQPNCMYFFGESSSLILYRVKSIYVHDEDPAIGTVFTVICDNGSQDDSGGNRYTIIAE